MVTHRQTPNREHLKEKTELVLLYWNSVVCVALFQLQDVWTLKSKVISIQALIWNNQSVFLGN